MNAIKIIFSFLYWSKWTDVSVFWYGGDTYLCQGKTNEINGKKQFRTVKMCFGINNGIQTEANKTV